MTKRRASGFHRINCLLAVLASARGEPMTPVQLQKALFLLGKRLPSVGGRPFYHFSPYAYGPFDPNVYTDAEVLAISGDIIIEPSEYGRYKLYRISEDGLRKDGQLGIDEDDRRIIDDVVEYVTSRSFQQLISDIYRQYPEMRVNSVFRE